MDKLTSYKMNLRSEAFTNKVPKIARYMLLQTWIANVELRHVEAMILDPLDWDHVPDAVDEKVQESKPEVKIKKDIFHLDF